LIDSPSTQKFLSKEDTDFYIRRLQADMKTGSKDQTDFKWKYVVAALTDWKIYLSTLIFWGNTVVVYGFIFTLPTAINDMGYSRAEAQLLTIPIYATACICVLIVSYFADRSTQRFPAICYPFLLCAVCFIALMAVPKEHSPGVRYGLLFGVAIGVYSPLCGIIAWNANNLAGSWKRSVGMALQITIGNLGKCTVHNENDLSVSTPRYIGENTVSPCSNSYNCTNK
jgi:predicted MFS family arabinose efflux permease